MTVLVTGHAGFIGNAVALALLERGERVVGIDSLTDYYSVDLKRDRLARLEGFDGYTDICADLSDWCAVEAAFEKHSPRRVIHLAAQPGVRYGLENPRSYASSNIDGTLNILEACRHYGAEHLVFASTSSVYGANSAQPFRETDAVDHPLSLYAATKRANELMAHSYAHLFDIPVTGLRFFTVYGPWGRPDMTPVMFTRKILAGEPIQIFNNGEMVRDFTYIDDIVRGVLGVLEHPPETGGALSPEQSPVAPYRILNIGNQSPTGLMDYIRLLERGLGVEAVKAYLPDQKGEVVSTLADSSALAELTGVVPEVPLEKGIRRFVAWYRDYYGCP